MTALKKFLFDTSFDSQSEHAAQKRTRVEESEAPEPPPPPSFSEEELAAARAEAHAAGKAEGLQEGMNSQERAAAEAFGALQGEVGKLLQIAEAQHEAQIHGATETAIEVVRKLFPRLAEARALQELEPVIAESLALATEEPRVVIRVSPTMGEPVTERLTALTQVAGFDGKLVTIPDEALEASSVRVEWAAGGAERDTARIWREIDGLLERWLTTLPPCSDEDEAEGGAEAAVSPDPLPAPDPAAAAAQTA